MKTLLLTLIIAFNLLACTKPVDSYADKFNDQIFLHSSRQYLIEVMGKPDSMSSYDLPLVPKLEQLMWKSTVTGRVYTVVLVSDNVVSKSVI